MNAAERGDLSGLRAAIGAKEKAGSLHNQEAADLARVVAEREIDHAGPKDALSRVREIRSCASELDDALERRMRARDDAGAEAALARLEDGRLDPDDAREYVASPDDGWRAVGARSLVREEDAAARARALVDPGPKVRRAAIGAMLAAGDHRALPALEEAARLDPELLVRTDAVRAIGLLAVPDGDVSNRLRDLWTGADDALREDIAAAWAAPAVFGAGGSEALRVLLASQDGPGVLAAAGAVLRAPRVRDAELLSAARARLARSIENDTLRNRLHAIAVAPLSPKEGEPAGVAAPILDAMRKASRDDDDGVRLAALSRLTESKPDRDPAVLALEAMAGRKDKPELGSRARLALARAGDLRVQAWIEEDLGAKDPEVRLSAVDALAALGRSGRGAPVLADADPSVRTRAACALLLAVRGR